MTIQEFINQNYIVSTITRVPFRTDINDKDWGKSAKHYAFRIYITEGDKYTTPDKTPLRGYYSQGSGIKTNPKTVDVLNAVVMDSMGINGTSFELWCGDFGYETDSRKAYATYHACLKESQQLKELLGLSLYNQLMECETL